MPSESELRQGIADERRALTNAVASLREELGQTAERAKNLGTAVGAVTGAALAAPIKVINNTDLPIDQLFASKPGEGTWGPDLMEGAPEGSLDPHMSYHVRNLKGGTWDLRMEAPDEGIFCVIKGVKVVPGRSLELTEEMAKGCK